MRLATQPLSVAIGELNGDGRPDLAIANVALEASSVSVLVNRGDGSFQPKVDYGTGHNPESVAIGDVTGDGKADLATANTGADTVSVLRNRGDGSFEAGIDYQSGHTPESVAIGDLNRDGKADLVSADSQDNGVSVFANRGAGSFEPKLQYEAGQIALSVAIGDLNGDRAPDLVTANEYDDSVSVIMNATVFCMVPNVRGKTLARAKQALEGADCSVGRVRRVHSKRVKRHRVISQSPKPGTMLADGAGVRLVVSRGKKH